MPALRMTLCLLRWNSLAATQSPPKNSRVTLRMGKTLEALTAPVERRRKTFAYTPASTGVHPLWVLLGPARKTAQNLEKEPTSTIGNETSAVQSGAHV